MAKVESRAADRALLWFTLARQQEEGESERASAMELVAAISAFLADWITPLAASIRVESCDREQYVADSKHPPTQEAWFLRQQQLDSRVLFGPSRIHSSERRLDKIRASDLLAVVEEALDQPPPLPHLEVTLAEVTVGAVEVALPDDVELLVNDGYKQVEPIVRREGRRSLVQGPDYNFYWAPVGLFASTRYGLAEIYVEVAWDFWLEHPAGLAQVHAAVARVLARGRGWTVTEGNLPPLAARDVPS